MSSKRKIRFSAQRGWGFLLRIDPETGFGNTIAEIKRRISYPGFTWDGFQQEWEAVNGANIWISTGSNRNEIKK